MINFYRNTAIDVEPYEIPAFDQIISLDFQFYIIIEDNGDWDFEDSNCTWAEGLANNGDWYSEQYHVYIGDKFDIAEAVYDLMTPILTITPGKYLVTGSADLLYTISNIYGTTKYVVDDLEIETNIDTKSAYIDLNLDKSKLSIDYYLIL